MTKPDIEEDRLYRVGQHLVLRRAGGDWSVLVDGDEGAGWASVSKPLASRLARQVRSGGEELEWGAARERQVRACAEEPVTDASASPSGSESPPTQRLFGWTLNPPLAFAGRRQVTAELASAAQDLVEAELPSEMDELDRVESEARAGWEQGRDRQNHVEERAAYFLGGAGVAATLLVGSGSLLLGADNQLASTPRAVVIVGLSVAVLGLAGCGAFALIAIMRTFGRISPDVSPQVIERADLSPEDARRKRIARLLAARRRTSYITTWKVARLRRAASCATVAMGGLLLSFASVIAGAL